MCARAPKSLHKCHPQMHPQCTPYCNSQIALCDSREYILCHSKCVLDLLDPSRCLQIALQIALRILASRSRSREPDCKLRTHAQISARGTVVTTVVRYDYIQQMTQRCRHINCAVDNLSRQLNGVLCFSKNDRRDHRLLPRTASVD